VSSQVTNKGWQAPGAVVAEAVEIRAVCTRRELTDFIKLPWQLYSDADNRWGLFGFFECVDDLEAARALFEAAESWLRARGRDRMVGPMDFSTNHECGLLVEGHELSPQILETWHHPYYADLFEAAGMQKAMDLYKWQIVVAEHERVLPIIYELADSLEAKHGIRVRNMRRRDFEAEVQRFMEIYNAAWEGNWGFVPLTQSELKAYAKELKPVLDERYAYIAETDDQVVGAALTLPDINKVLAKLMDACFRSAG